MRITKPSYRIIECIRDGTSDFILAESNSKLHSFMVWQALRVCGGKIILNLQRRSYLLYSDAVSDLLYRAKRSALDSGTYLDADDCVGLSLAENYAGKVVTVAPFMFRLGNRKTENQLQYVARDSDNKEHTPSDALDCLNIRYGYRNVWQRMDMQGTPLPDKLPDLAKESISKITKKGRR